MEYDSTSSCDERLRDLETRSDLEARKISKLPSSWRQSEGLPAQPKVAFNVNKSLSKQVMEYYKKYSQNANLDQYFSLPETSGQTRDVEYYYSIYELNSRPESGRQDCVGKDYNLANYVPRERRRWARPPLIGQSSNSADNSAIYRSPLTEPRSPSPEAKLDPTETIVEEAERNESRETVTDIPERKSNPSPTSSVNSHKPLEWDSGADVGYFNTLPQNKQGNKKLSTIERMALAGGCSAALRQDPEGTTESNLSNKGPGTRSGAKSKRKPDANSTPLPGNISETESEIEITPIVKNHASGMITGDDIRSEKKALISLPAFKVPPVKYATEGKKKTGDSDLGSSPLKKSSSMNILAPVSAKLLLKRSQSDFNLRGKDKARANLPLIFDSTSSLATVVNKPMTCDKVIQTTINEHFQESIGVQVSVFEEEKPPVPKRGTSLGQKGIQSILKTSKNTYRLQDSRKCEDGEDLGESGNGTRPSSTDISRDDSRPLSPYQQDDTEDLTGRANSFEYFPGHVYENVPNGSNSHVSSIDTRRSNSTMPNTSSSIDEKLWGDSDSLVRDLERSVNILKSLVDANKCDKQVKKRLIHHVVKRLVTAKYTDDKIEHNLEENVPWNPDDARKKVYRTDIIQALTKKQNTTDSSEEWKPVKQKKGTSARKQLNEEARIVDDMITLESSNSDKFDAQTDRTEMDGRKARMGLRTDDCQRSSNSPTDINKSESSECFMPQRRDKAKPRDNIFCFKQTPEVQNRDTSTSDTPLDRNRIYLEAAVDKRQSTMESSNGTRNSTDWRLPTTLSERQFELRRRSTSESGDSKLVSYAETEKKNQLLWITNEISHLSNLKKLLEQPKKLDRQRMSPRKVKHAIVKQKPLALLKCVCGSDNPVVHEAIARSGFDMCDDSVNQQWSSHCNLATCQSTVGSISKNINHLKKRNSCTQTGSDAVRAHSQTGGEIISTIPRTRIPETKFANIHVQTSPDDTLPRVVCPIHKDVPSSQKCKCLGQVCRCTRERPSELEQNLSNKICLCHSSDSKSSYKEFSSVCHRRSPSPRWNEASRKTIDLQPIVGQISGNENKKSEAKEAKNKVNATKSLHTCDCEVPRICQCVGGNCSCESTLAHKNMTRRCDLCLKKITQNSRCNCGKGQDEKLCVCDNMKRKDEKMCGCPAGCNCENRKVDDKICGCYRDRKCKCKCSGPRLCCLKSQDQKAQVKPYYLSNSNEAQLPQLTRSQNEGLCKCGKDCCCENKLSDIENRLYNAKRSARTNCSCESRVSESNESNYHHCRSCGSMYKNGRKCNCHVNYPKPIAYELSFADGKVQKNSEAFVNKKNGKVETKKFNKGNGSNSPTDTPKSGGCFCEETKSCGSSRNSGRSKTLQDYLAQNKPEFVNNVETRQQCMFEISHLRELRRAKRVQLLAMASGTNLTKTPRTQKPKAVPTQRKISDEEMKERLRKRYYKLHEVRNKRQLREKQEQARRNKLMANIFCKKLQQKVLKGQVDLSNSVSVISNL